MHTAKTEFIFLLFKKYVRSNFHGWHNIRIGCFVVIAAVYHIDLGGRIGIIYQDGFCGAMVACIIKCIGLDACRVTHKRKTSNLVHLIWNGVILWQSDTDCFARFSFSYTYNIAFLYRFFHCNYIQNS